MRLPSVLPAVLLIALVQLTPLLTACHNNQDNQNNNAEPTAMTPISEAATASAVTPGQNENTAATDPATGTTAVVTDAATSSGAPTSLAAYQQSLTRRCESDADCVVKNVGSCCGYTPQCVHRDVVTFPAEVKALCEKEGRSSICGFQEPAGCACVDNQCRASAGTGL